MADDYCFAQIVPINQEALTAFKTAVSDALEENDTSRLRFYVSTDGHSIIPLHSIDPQGQYAVLSLSDQKLPQFPRLGWRIGKRLRNVDIAIASSIFEGDVKFRLSVHPRSGILMLQASASIVCPLEYANTAQELLTLAPEQSLPLLYPSTRIVIAGCDFDIRYTVTKAKQADFSTKLQHFLFDQYGTYLHTKGKVLPSNGHFIFLRTFALSAKVGKGTFGDVWYAIDSGTGNPVAVKDVRLTNSASRREFFEEIAILEQLKGDEHFLQLIDCWCEEHGKHPAACPGRAQEHYYMVTDLALYSFREPDFLVQFTFRSALELFRQILGATQVLHSRGVTHRDLTLANMLVLSSEPLKAVIGDFGKACRSLEHTSSAIGPIVTCAPEVWSGRYDCAVDLWSWAYAVLDYLGYRPSLTKDHDRARAGRINPFRLEEMRNFLRITGESSEEQQMGDLCDLLLSIFVWDARGRVSVEEALAHPVWREGDAQPKSLKEDVGADRPRKKQDRGSSAQEIGRSDATAALSGQSGSSAVKGAGKDAAASSPF